MMTGHAYGSIGRNFIRFPLTSYPSSRVPARGIGGLSRIDRLYVYRKPSFVSVNTAVATLDAKPTSPAEIEKSDFVKDKGEEEKKDHSLVPTKDNQTLEPTLKPIKLAEGEIKKLEVKKRQKKAPHNSESSKKRKKHHKFQLE